MGDPIGLFRKRPPRPAFSSLSAARRPEKDAGESEEKSAVEGDGKAPMRYPMGVKSSELNQYLAYLEPLLEGRYLSRATSFAPGVVSFRVSGSDYPRLTFAIEGSEPRFYLARTLLEGKSLETTFLDVLKKHLYRAQVRGLSLLGGDRILDLELLASEEALFPKERHLVFEMFPRHANLILLDEERKVLTAYRTSSIEDKRPLFRGLNYEVPPQNAFQKEDIPLNLDATLKHYDELEAEILASRKKERFGELEKYLRSRKKALEKKAAALERDLQGASSRLDAGRKGELIYTYFDEIDQNAPKVVLEGVEIALDPRKNLAQNAEAYYRQAKKAKETVALGNKHLEECREELSDVESAISQYEASDEEGLEQMAKELSIPEKGRPKAGWKGLSRSSLPYECHIGETRLLYGKSAKENDCLSFLFARGKKLHWFHIMGDSGSHLVLKSEEPTKKEIELAAEIACLLSGKEDGDVMHALRGDVRKGSVSGQAVVKKFETIHVRSVSEEARTALRAAHKAEKP